MNTEETSHIKLLDEYILTYTMPEFSNWKCYLFGSTPGSGMMWQPYKGQEPNWFWRWMQYICFGNRWIKE